MRHTFLTEPGHWLACGEFITRSGEVHPVEGETRIEHERRIWRNSGILRVASEPPVEYRNVYEITPLPPGSTWTSWTSLNPALGRLAGRFLWIADAILSLYQSEDGAYHGCEAMLFESPASYRCRGALLRGGVPLASWSVILHRRTEVEEQ